MNINHDVDLIFVLFTTDSCKLQPLMEETISHCRDVYSAMDDVELSYDEGWQEYNRTSKFLRSICCQWGSPHENLDPDPIRIGDPDPKTTLPSHIPPIRS